MCRFLKVIMMLLLLLSSQISKATDFVTVNNCDKTNEALTACKEYVEALNDENVLLQQKIALMTKQQQETEAALQKASTPPLIPVWGWFLIGTAVGVSGYAIIHH